MKMTRYRFKKNKCYTQEQQKKVLELYLSMNENTVSNISELTEISINKVNIIINHYWKNKFKH